MRRTRRRPSVLVCSDVTRLFLPSSRLVATGSIVRGLRPWLLLAAAAALLFALTPETTPFNGPVLLANQFRHGIPYMPGTYRWMETYTIGGHTYLAYPPMVSAILVPAVLIFGHPLHQPTINTALIIGAMVLLYLLLRSFDKSKNVASLGAIAYAFGTPMVFSAHRGDVWLLMHSEANFFLMLALYLGFVKRQHLLAGVAYMIAGQCRHAVLPFALTFALLIWQGRAADPGASIATSTAARIRGLAAFGFGASLPGLAALVLQWWINGDPLESPYMVLFNKVGSGRSYFSGKYLLRNLSFYTLARPQFSAEFPFLHFGYKGQSIWSMSPFFFGIFALSWRKWPASAPILGILGGLGVYLVYWGTGYSQFGSRYLSDLYPGLVLVAFLGLGGPGRWRRVAVPALVALSIFMNTYGTYIYDRYPRK